MNRGLDAIRRGLLIDDILPLDEEFPELSNATSLEVRSYIDWKLKLIRRIQQIHYNELQRMVNFRWYNMYEKLLYKAI